MISPRAGELASVSDWATNSFLTTLTTHRAWIGGYKDQSQWKWSDKTVWNFENWAPNQPDNTWNVEDSLVFNFATNRYGTGQWNDAKGLDAKEFICQYQGEGIINN